MKNQFFIFIKKTLKKEVSENFEKGILNLDESDNYLKMLDEIGDFSEEDLQEAYKKSINSKMNQALRYSKKSR